jgi:uncharacterized protein YyaL (SSP411 family)
MPASHTLGIKFRAVVLGLILIAGSWLPASEKSEPAEGNQHPANRLAKESSPYLLLHAHNPVDWYPWGPEAFAAAKKQNKPIFLSIGYSSCYWCHVMERLVFENEEIAAAMNENFINVKVDREERPDVDDIYMTSLIVYNQLIGSPAGGGWPLSMFLTPEGKPFAGGSYFPPEDTPDGRLGFPGVMERVVNLWAKQEDAIRQNADTVTRVVKQQMAPPLNLQEVTIEKEDIQKSVAALKESYDPEFGGIDFNAANPNAPKFPTPSKLSLLMRQAREANDEEAKQIVLDTLTHVARGGIRDHLGGGFHRYSTDRKWLVPHFEKMLYDQAQLASIYLEAWEMTEDPLFREAAVETLEFVLREMTGETGGFYSAIDAETDNVEGKYYVWEKDEIRELLGDDAYPAFAAAYGLGEPKPFEHGYVLHLPRPLAETARYLKLNEQELRAHLEPAKQKLLEKRSSRERPLLDDKVLVSWNGLMIRAFAEAGRILGEPRYTDAAVKAAEFIEREMTGDNRLLRTARENEAKLNAYLDDYACYVAGLLALHETTGDKHWLTKARTWTDRQLELFWDETSKAFFFTSHDHEELIARSKNAYDAVLPSGNSLSALNLLALSGLTGEEEYRARAGELLKVFAPVYDQSPRSLSILSLALAEYFESAETEAGDGQQSAISPRHTLIPVAYQPGNADDHKLKFRPYLNTNKLVPGKTSLVAVVVDIEKGWHINSNPAAEFFIPTVFKMKSDDGLKLKKVTYPKGKKLELEGIDEPLLVYEGRVILYAELEVPKSLAGKSIKVRMDLEYQACNDKKCLPKKTFGGDLTLPVAKEGEQVEPANEKYFPEKK